MEKRYKKRNVKKKEIRLNFIITIMIVFLLFVEIIITKIVNKRKKSTSSITINMNIKKQIIKKYTRRNKKYNWYRKYIKNNKLRKYTYKRCICYMYTFI